MLGAPLVPVDLEAVRAAFGLPQSLEVVSYHHGASGTWRLKSGSVDTFAVKVTAKLDDWTRTQHIRQGQLEQAAPNAGVAMPEVVAPLFTTVGLSAEVDGQLVGVHRWVDTLPGGKHVDPEALRRWLGGTLALLHQLIPLGRHEDAELAQAYGVHPMEDWTEWVEDAHRRELAWAPLGSELLDVIPAATALVQNALADHTIPRCLTHRDVNPPNVLHTQDGPALSDFSYAGPDVAWLEAVSTAASFDAPMVLPAYLEAGGRTGPMGTAALARAVGSAANWLAFNMWLSLGHRDVDESRRREATLRLPSICREFIDEVGHQDAARRTLLSAVQPASGRHLAPK